MRFILFTLLLILFNSCSNKDDNTSYIEALLKERKETNKYFATPGKSPLSKEEARLFTSLNYYPIDTNYRVIAEITKIDTAKPFQMPTTTSRLPWYKKVGMAVFNINQKTDTLYIFENLDDEEDDVLFIPFLDETNGFDTYGGGRYLDLASLEPPVYLDFNKAYNPYCAYNHDFSCPIPPLENQLSIKIEAGEKTFKAY